MVIENGIVRSNHPLAREIYRMDLDAPEISASAKPGQFVNVLITGDTHPLLRRPMSVASCNDGRIALIYKAIGTGTLAMRDWKPGERVSLLGPLGNGWMVDGGRFPILVGGGVGIAPVYYLHEEFQRQGVEHLLLMGARLKEEHFLAHAPEDNIYLATDDGSTGITGTVVDGLEECLMHSANTNVIIYGCGPSAMLRSLISYAKEQRLPCQVATEEMMACGIGLCQGCAVEVNTDLADRDASNRQKIKLACLDGPVFWAHELA